MDILSSKLPVGYLCIMRHCGAIVHGDIVYVCLDGQRRRACKHTEFEPCPGSVYRLGVKQKYYTLASPITRRIG